MDLPLMQTHPSLSANGARGRTITNASQPGRIMQYVFAVRIPHLPLPTFAHASALADEQAVLRDAIGRAVQIVHSLSVWKGAGFSLRFLSQPRAGSISLFLAARIPAHSDDEAAIWFMQLSALFRSYQIQVEPVTDAAGLIQVLSPFPDAYAADVYQQEDVLSMISGDAYVVYPYGGRQTDWVAWFATLLSQREDCLISLYLEPTALDQEEQNRLAMAAHYAENLATVRPIYATPQEVRDPIAKRVADIYRDWSVRLQPSCAVVVAQFASPALPVAMAAAGVFCAQINGPRPAPADATLQTGATIAVAHSPDQRARAFRNLACVQFEPWAPTSATPGKEWLRYLADPETAGSLFRLPVPLRGDVPGVEVRRSF